MLVDFDRQGIEGQAFDRYSAEGQERVQAILHTSYIVSSDVPRYDEGCRLLEHVASMSDLFHLDAFRFSSVRRFEGETNPKKEANGC